MLISDWSVVVRPGPSYSGLRMKVMRVTRLLRSEQTSFVTEGTKVGKTFNHTRKGFSWMTSMLKILPVKNVISISILTTESFLFLHACDCYSKIPDEHPCYFYMRVPLPPGDLYPLKLFIYENCCVLLGACITGSFVLRDQSTKRANNELATHAARRKWFGCNWSESSVPYSFRTLIYSDLSDKVDCESSRQNHARWDCWRHSNEKSRFLLHGRTQKNTCMEGHRKTRN